MMKALISDGPGMKNQMDRRIFAIGGGEIRGRETLEIDKRIVEAAGKANPRLLFIPTASSEAEGYIRTVREYFGDGLGCTVESLLLIDSTRSKQEIREIILSSDIIYAGGGNTRFMMDLWKQKGVDSALREALEKGIVLSGLSAGSICWFRSGQSDSDFSDEQPAGRYSCVEGLGFIPLLHAPHHNEDHRAADFPLLVKEQKMPGLAISNNCALEIRGNQYRVIRSSPEAYALKVVWHKKEIIENRLDIDDVYRPLSDLTDQDKQTAV